MSYSFSSYVSFLSHTHSYILIKFHSQKTLVLQILSEFFNSFIWRCLFCSLGVVFALGCRFNLTWFTYVTSVLTEKLSLSARNLFLLNLSWTGCFSPNLNPSLTPSCEIQSSKSLADLSIRFSKVYTVSLRASYICFLHCSEHGNTAPPFFLA